MARNVRDSAIISCSARNYATEYTFATKCCSGTIIRCTGNTSSRIHPIRSAFYLSS